MAYNKHNYTTGQTLEASSLNEMDDQIAANESKLATIEREVGDNITQVFYSLTGILYIAVNSMSIMKCGSTQKKDKVVFFKCSEYSYIQIVKPYSSNRFRVYGFDNEDISKLIKQETVGTLLYDNASSKQCIVNTNNNKLIGVYIQNNKGATLTTEEYPIYVTFNVNRVGNLDSSFFEKGGLSDIGIEVTDDTKYRSVKISGSKFNIAEKKSDKNIYVYIYSKEGTFFGKKELIDTLSLSCEFIYRFVVTSDSIDTTDIDFYCNTYKENDIVQRKSIINPSWENWNDVRYSYGFDKTTTNIYNEVEGTFETDTMFSVRGGKGRWTYHVFEGWGKLRKGRLTMLVSKFHEMMACIQVYSPAGLYEDSRRFGWVKIGSDEENTGVDFSRYWIISNSYLRLRNSSSDPTTIIDGDLHPHLNDDSMLGTIYYNSSLDELRIKKSNGWENVGNNIYIKHTDPTMNILGEEFHMPTYEEANELINNTTVVYAGEKYIVLKSNLNNNIIKIETYKSDSTLVTLVNKAYSSGSQCALRIVNNQLVLNTGTTVKIQSLNAIIPTSKKFGVDLGFSSGTKWAETKINGLFIFGYKNKVDFTMTITNHRLYVDAKVRYINEDGSLPNHIEYIENIDVIDYIKENFDETSKTLTATNIKEKDLITLIKNLWNVTQSRCLLLSDENIEFVSNNEFLLNMLDEKGWSI